MIGYILRRILSAIPLLIGISIVSFIIIQLPPGDFATSYEMMLMNQGNMSRQEAQAAADQYRALYGLDKPLYEQYFIWIKGIVTEGKFGYSFAYKKDVGELIWERLPRTLFLALAAHFISTFFGLLIGIYAATHKYSLGDNLAAVLAGAFAPSLRLSAGEAAGSVIGGVLLGIGAMLASGCNISAYVSGIASGSLHGWAWILPALAGNWVGLRLRPALGLAVPAEPDTRRKFYQRSRRE
jgi:ABC-type dipeptide/oligopeptide/nickel transport system permease component